MGKYGTLGAVLMTVMGFIVFFALSYGGEFQDNSIIEPANATMTVGEMRMTPHGGSDVDENDSKPQGAKGMRAQDLIVEVTNEIIEDKADNTVYTIDWKFVDVDGNEIEDAKNIVNGTNNPVVTEAEYTINRYNSTQVDSEGNIRDVESPMNSTKFKWGIYTDPLARTGQPVGLGGEETRVDFTYYTNGVSEDSKVGDYDRDGVNNINEIRTGENPYGYVEGDAIKDLGRDSLGR